MNNDQRSTRSMVIVSLLCVVALSLFKSAPVSAAFPYVIFPSAKGITLAKGGAYTIEWGSVRVDPVNILLCEELPDELFCFSLIAAGVPNSGSYSWTVPSNLPNGSNYVIGVGVSGVSIAFSDNPFTINNSPPASWSVGGTIKTLDGTDICAMVLASGKFMFSCNPPGKFSLTNLPKENDGTLKRQIYADGFFPKVDILADSTNDAVVMTRSGTCPRYNASYDPAFVPNSSGKRINIAGKVLTQNSQIPICAMVLANGKYTFSCNATGSYALNIPLDNNGQFKLQVYADGFAPMTQVYDEFKTTNNARMARATECQ